MDRNDVIDYYVYMYMYRDIYIYLPKQNDIPMLQIVFQLYPIINTAKIRYLMIRAIVQ